MSSTWTTLVAPLATLAVGGVVALYFSAARASVVDSFFRSGPPVNVSMEQEPDPAHGPGAWALPDNPDLHGEDSIKVGPQLAKLISEHRGATASATQLRVTVQGNRNRQVVIRDIHARVVNREAPLRGALFMEKSQGSNDSVRLGLQLDEVYPVTRDLDRDHGNVLTEPHFANHFVTLNTDEAATFQIMASTERSYVTYELVISTVVEGKAEDVVVRDGTQPFRVTALADHYGAVFASRSTPEILVRTGSASPCASVCSPAPPTPTS